MRDLRVADDGQNVVIRCQDFGVDHFDYVVIPYSTTGRGVELLTEDAVIVELENIDDVVRDDILKLFE